jgi:methylaspartate mutase epsilon subunit
MISSMDGHARYYMRQFPELMQQYKVTDPLWYLGGNLHIGNGLGYEAEFLHMGFNRVFVKFVDVLTVLDMLKRDLAEVTPVTECEHLWKQPLLSKRYPTDVPDRRLNVDEFERERKEVLSLWKTGRQAKDLEANAAFLSKQPSFSRTQALVNIGRLKMLVQPRSGVPLLDQQINLFNTFKNVAVRVLSYQVDSMTRNNNYVGAEIAICESRVSQTSTLNGFPVINHGVKGLRRVIQEVRLPLQTRHSTRDPRLLAEISYAGAVTSFEGGAICYNIPYYKNYPLDEAIRNWQYVDHLTGLYYQRYGVVLDREFFGTLTATLIPPCFAIVVNIIETLLAVRQGAKAFSLGYAEQGHRAQDIAAIRMLEKLTREYLDHLGYKDVQISTVFHQYMAAFPPCYQQSANLIYNSAITAALSGATRVIVKTPAEAVKIPEVDDNIHGINLVQRGLADAESYHVEEERVAAECEQIRREVEAILDSLIYCGKGDLARGVVEGFAKGFLDIPFSPSIYNRGEVATARDMEGAVRFLSFGNLQLDQEVREFHQDKMNDRRRAEKLLSSKQDYLLVERDVMQIARAQYESWPLSA